MLVSFGVSGVAIVKPPDCTPCPLIGSFVLAKLAPTISRKLKFSLTAHEPLISCPFEYFVPRRNFPEVGAFTANTMQYHPLRSSFSSHKPLATGGVTLKSSDCITRFLELVPRLQ